MSYTVNPNDPSTPTNDQGATQGAEELRALKTKIQAIVAGAFIVSAAGANPADCVNLLYPDINDRPAMVAGGWKPWNLNQQWGGAGCMPFHQVDAATGTEYKFDAFDGYIQDEGLSLSVGSAVGQFYGYQVLNPSKNQSLQAFWLKLYKTLNPVDNCTVQLWSVAAGVPNVLVATATVINGKQITSDSNGQWYRFAFAAVQALVAGTQYVIVLSKSGGVDAANYYNWKGTTATATKYPNNLSGFGTAVPAWTTQNTVSRCFLCEAQASDQPIQSAGTFDGRIVGSGTGNPINRSTGYCNDLKNVLPLFNPNGWSFRIGGKSWTKDCTIFDAIWGLHHDRINVRCAVGTGFTTVTLYDKNNVVNTLVGTSDISTAAYKDIWIAGRTMGDGGDYLRIYTGIAGVWTKEIEVTGQTYSLDPLMLRQGTAWIMGGFPLFAKATYTNYADMSVLPSGAPGYTFTTTTATVEGNVFAISGNKLSQVKSGMAAGGDGWYRKNPAALSNANGWLAACKVKTLLGTNTKDEAAVWLQIVDGVKIISLRFQEHYYQSGNAGTNTYPQVDCKSTDNPFLFTGKGSDFFVFNNGKLGIDGTGLLTSANAANLVDFGDNTVTANENGDASWSYVGYYSPTNILPQFTSGELHEFASFSGEKGTLGSAIYNAGVPLSVKQYCGIGKNYAGQEIEQRFCLRAVTNQPNTASTTGIVQPEMECFVLSAEFTVQNTGSVSNDSAGQFAATRIDIDGSQPWTGVEGRAVSVVSNAVYWQSNACRIPPTRKTFGLHKIEAKYYASANNAYLIEKNRSLDVSARL